MAWSKGMPKGVYMRRGEDLGWSEEMDEFLKERCASTDTYGVIRQKFNAKFGATKSRSAIIAHARRKGWTILKPSSGEGQTLKRRSRRVVSKPKQVINVRRKQNKQLAKTVVMKQTAELRDESDRGTAGLKRSRKLGSLNPEVIERKKGNLPAIIEENPLTSVPVADCEGAESCMWPTSADVTRMEVCGARVEVGAYCSRHAAVAYRVLPTKRRQGTHGKQDLEHTRRIDGSQYRDALDRDGEWLGRMIMDEVVTAPADQPPLMLERKKA